MGFNLVFKGLKSEYLWPSSATVGFKGCMIRGLLTPLNTSHAAGQEIHYIS